MNCRWVIQEVEPEKVQELSASLQLSKIASTILVARGLKNAQEASQFLNPKLAYLHHPNCFCGMKEAAQRIHQAILENEKICIYGDYDVDGVTSISLVYECLQSLGAQVFYYIPNRLTEGYGLHLSAIHKIAEYHAQLMITVDCGISEHEAIAEANRLGITVIVTDHHEVGAMVPNALAVINPKDHRGNYPFKGIAGVGVAFKLAWAIFQTFSNDPDKVLPEHRAFLLNALSLVALGTIADVAPLRDENRVMAHFGLMVLQNTSNLGLKALKEVARLSQVSPLKAEHIGFRLGPRLNAMGRLEESFSCVELLTTKNIDSAQHLAKRLDLQNQRRKNIQEKIYQQAKEQIDSKGLHQNKVLTLAHEEWHPGVVGIVASRLLEEFYRPVLMIALSNGEGRGSARSIPGFHLFHALQEAEPYLISYGGHELAAGFKVNRDKITQLDECLNKRAASLLAPVDLQPVLLLDALVDLSEINWDLIRQLAQMEPFGEGNPEPVLMAKNLEIVRAPSPEKYGPQGEHLGFRVRQGSQVFKAIAFGAGNLYSQVQQHRYCDLAFTPKKNSWANTDYIQLQVKDILFR